MGEENIVGKNNKTIDRIQAVWNKLGGEEGVDRLLQGDLKLVPNFKIWKSIKIGSRVDLASYRKAARLRKLSIDGSVRPYVGGGSYPNVDLTRANPFSSENGQVDFVLETVKNLGFNESTTISEVNRRVREFGYELCSEEAALEFSLKCRNSDYVHFAMEPMVSEWDITASFYLWADGDEVHLAGNHNLKISPEDYVAFVKPRK